MAELIGAIIGDGNSYDNRPSYVELCGNPITDRAYFQDVLITIVRSHLAYNPRLFIRDGGLRFRINNKEFVKWLVRIGLPSGGAKSDAVIPDGIFRDRRLQVSCVRGIYDTDGSVYFDCRPSYRRPYPRIELHMANLNLLTQVSWFLKSKGIVHSFVESKGALETAGPATLSTFLRQIGFSNSRHLSRIGRYFPQFLSSNLSKWGRQEWNGN